MKTTLTCDSVFEVLTRGPFPSGGADDEQVERHLAACHECRRLAEALQPAVALFHETMHDEPGASLPEYRGRLSHAPKTARVRTAAIDAVHRRGPVRRERGDTESATQLVRFASASLLALSLFLLVWTAGSLAGRSGMPRQTPETFGRVKASLGGGSYLALVSLDVPARCLPWESAAAAEAGSIRIQCCTECHAAAHPRQEVCQAAWTQSCKRCHEAGEPQRATTKSVAIARQACEVCHDG